MAIPLMQLIAVLPVTIQLSVILQFFAAAASALLIVGLWTPIAGSLLAISELSLFFLFSGARSSHIIVAAVGAALAMIGPGAWSVDARLFGRKRIRIPQ